MKKWKAVRRILTTLLVVFVILLFLTGAIDFTKLRTTSWTAIMANLDTIVKIGIGFALGVAVTLIVQSNKGGK